MSITHDDAREDSRARRAAKLVGLKVTKSRRMFSGNNLGGCCLIDPEHNAIVAGERFDLTPAEVLEFCTG